MAHEMTALLTIWPHDEDRSGGQTALYENFRPIWRCGRTRMTALPDEAFLVGFASHFTTHRSPLPVQLPEGRNPLMLTRVHRRRLLTAYTGWPATLIRYDRCVIDDEQVRAARACGIVLDVMDIRDHEPTPKGRCR